MKDVKTLKLKISTIQKYLLKSENDNIKLKNEFYIIKNKNEEIILKINELKNKTFEIRNNYNKYLKKINKELNEERVRNNNLKVSEKEYWKVMENNFLDEEEN